MKASIFMTAVLPWLACSMAYAQQDSVAMRYASTITEADLRTYLTVLASDEYEGRETGMKGQKKAAQYIMEHFEEFGIPPVPEAEKRGLINGYQLPYPLELSRPGGISIAVNGQALGFMQDFFYFGQKMEGESIENHVVFAGFGIKDSVRNDYAKVDANDRTALVLQEDTGPLKKSDRPTTSFFQMLSKKTADAESAGVRILLVACSNAHEMMKEYAHFITTPRMKLGGEEKLSGSARRSTQTIIIDKATAERILKRGGLTWNKAVKRARKSVGTSLSCPVTISAIPERQEITAEDVLGYLEGGDKKEEVLLVTAHYDHIGMDDKGEVYNGADDDGSGTVSVMEMAQAFARAKAEGHGPRRSILFMTLSGEEKGLLGSQWYSEHPVFALANTIADLNIDMIGRVDTIHQKNDHYVYIIGSDRLSSELHVINERANDTYTGLDLDYTFNAESDPNRFYYRSDHYNFARFGIPIIFYFNGVHADYHQLGDEVQKIRFDLLRQRAQLVFYTAWELANRDQRIVVDKPIKKE